MTIIVVTHEMGFARKVANRFVFMDGGEILEDRPTAEFFTTPATERALNGRQPAEMTLAGLMRRYAVGWREQRARTAHAH